MKGKGIKMARLINADEAFRILSDYYHHRTETQADALREALDRVPEAVVDENECIVRETIYPFATKQRVIGVIVRCRDCIYWQDQKEGVVEVPICKYDCRGNKKGVVIVMGADDYCSHGERRTDDE